MMGEKVILRGPRIERARFYVLAALLCACLMSFVPSTGFAVTHCGAITSNQIWRAADNPHIVTCEVIVNTGVTLTIQAGAIVRFQYGCAMTVNGSLKAMGTALDGIYFTSSKDTTGGSPNKGDWKRVLFKNTSGSDSLVYCQFRYGGYEYYAHSYPFVAVEGCSPTFINCTVRDGYFDAFSFSAGAHAYLKGCAIYNNNGVAMGADVASIPLWEGDYGPVHIHDNISGGVAYNGIMIFGGTIQQNTHWTCMGTTSDAQYTQYGIPFFIGTNDLIIASGTTLRLDPGVRLNFLANLGLTVNGMLKAIGTGSKNILFTSYKDVTAGSPAAADWKCVIFSASSTNDSLVYCQFRYGGYEYYGHSYPLVAVEGCSPTFINCTVRDGYFDGFSLSAGAHAYLRDCAIYNNNGVAMGVDVASIPLWEGDYGPVYLHDNISGGVAYNGIVIFGGTIQQNTHWTCMGTTSDAQYTQYGIPFFIGTADLIIASGTTLRLDPGVRLNFLANLGLTVNGTLKAMGTSSKNILFTSYKDVTAGSPADADWKCVTFTASSTNDSLIYCQFRYGGYEYYAHSYPLVAVEGCSPTFINCTARDGYSHGMSFTAGAHAFLKDCKVYNNLGAAVYIDVSSMPVWEGTYGPGYIFGNTYNSVECDGIYLNGGTISENTHWHSMGSKYGSNMGLPFYIGGSNLAIGGNVTLELDAGVSLLFTSNISLVVNGTLNALGEADKQILFASYLDSPTTGQYWKQILFNPFSSGTMEFCEIQYAGYNNNYALIASASSPTIQHCTIQNCTIGLIKTENAGCPAIHYSSLITGSTTKYGILSDCACPIDARFCYFGDPTGPYNPTTNPGGKGARVSDCVTYSPWWSSLYGVPDIAVRPDKIGQAVQLNSTFNRDLRIINGDVVSVLSYSISEGIPAAMLSRVAGSGNSDKITEIKNGSNTVALVDVPWVSVQPASGLVSPGDTAHVTVTFNANGMVCPSSHQAYLIIHNNDPEADPIIIPLDMEVIMTGICGGDSTLALPRAFCLGPNYPNPFNPVTTLTYNLQKAGAVKLAVYDVQGRRVKCLVDEAQSAGAHSVIWNGVTETGLQASSGVYFVRIESQGQAKTRKIILAR